MIDWYQGKIIRKVNAPCKKDEKRKVVSRYYHGTERGYHENNVEFTLNRDKSISIYDDEYLIYLYPEQVKHLKSFLRGK